MSRAARLFCLLAILPIAGCYVPDYLLRPKVTRADANGIVIVAGASFNPYNMAALHCQHYGKLSVFRGSEITGQYQRTFIYACQ